MTPQRGEVWQVDLGLAGKVRPALVVSVAPLDHERALHVIVPHTTALRGTRFEVELRVPGLDPGAFDCQQLIAIPRAKLLRRRAVLSTPQLQSIEAALRLVLALP